MDGTEASTVAVVPRFTHRGSPMAVVCPYCKRLAGGAGWHSTSHCTPREYVTCWRDPLGIIMGGRPFEWAMVFAPVAPVGGTAAYLGSVRVP